MNLMQTAAEAARGTSGVWLDASMIVLIVTNVGLLGRDYLRARKRNGSMTPGKSPDCLEHRDKLTRLEEWRDGADGDLKEIKGDIKTLLQRIPPRD